MSDLKKEEFDYVLVEGSIQLCEAISKAVKLEKIYYHTHGGCFLQDDVVQKRMSNYCQGIIAVSNYIKQCTLLRTNKEKSQVSVLYNGIDLSQFNYNIWQPYREEVRNQLGIARDEVAILFCGRIIPEKGIKELLDAIKLLPSVLSFKLIIVGSSNFAQKIKTEFERQIEDKIYSQREKIVFTGFIPNDKLPQIYAASDIFVSPSICQDAAPLNNLEAQAMGLPIITTKMGGIPEYITPQNAILLENDLYLVQNLGKALVELIENKGRRQEMSISGQENSKKYSVKNFYENLIKILKTEG